MAIIEKLWDVAWDMWEHPNRVPHKEKEALLHQQEDTTIRAEFAVGFGSFPMHLHTHTRRSATCGVTLEA
jgi:ribosome-associated toxin RatA of RatAB toxin-antitoxin module